MIVPQGMTEQEVIDIILKISNRLAPKYVFAGYEVEDIVQESFIIGINGLKNYDPSRPLENFMHTHINNRLKTFKRDNYFRMDYGSPAQKIQDRKKNLLEPVSIDTIYSIYSTNIASNDAHISEMLELIDRKLPSHLRRDYLKLQSGAPLPKNRKAQIISVIERIINGEDPDAP